jgi:hypothetical protein
MISASILIVMKESEKDLKLIILADIKEYLPLLERDEVSMSKFAALLNEAANRALRKHSAVKPASDLRDGNWGEYKPGDEFYGG